MRSTTIARCYFALNDRIYGSWAWAFDPLAYAFTFGKFRRWRRAAFQYITGARVLELGHGSGDLLVEMRKRGLEPVGLERSAGMNQLATRRLERAHLAVPRVQGDARTLPFKAGSFDSVVVTFPTSYAQESVVLADVHRILRKTGQPHGSEGAVVLVGVALDSAFAPVKAILRWLMGQSSEARVSKFVQALETARFQTRITRSPGYFLRMLSVVGTPRTAA